MQLQVVLDKEYEIARDAIASGRKTQARLALQRRAYQRGLIERTESQLTTLLELVSTIEFAQLEQSVMHGLEQGNQVLKEIHKETSIERVDALMDQTAEAQYYQRVCHCSHIRKSMIVLRRSYPRMNRKKWNANWQNWLQRRGPNLTPRLTNIRYPRCRPHLPLSLPWRRRRFGTAKLKFPPTIRTSNCRPKQAHRLHYCIRGEEILNNGNHEIVACQNITRYQSQRAQWRWSGPRQHPGSHRCGPASCCRSRRASSCSRESHS